MRKTLFGVYHPFHKACLLALDIASIALAFFLATKIRLGNDPEFFSLEYFGLNAVVVTCLFIGNGYTSKALGSQPRLPLNTFFIVLASAIPSTLFIYLLGPDRFTDLFGRGIFPVAIIILGALAVLARIILNHVFRGDNALRKLLVLGDVRARDHFDTALKQGLLGFDLEHYQTLEDVPAEAHFDAIVITPEHHASKTEQQGLIAARLSGTPIFSLSDFFESFLFLVPVNEIDNDWFIRAEGFTMLHSSVALRVKRAADIISGVILIIVTLPLTILTGVFIAFSSRGPIFFSQTRVGFKGELFTLYKFRTMRDGAEKDGAQWAKSEDDRIIPLGGFLRKTRIDELPQCWNILKGEMSIVGPRPERPEFTSMLAKEIPYYDLRHIIKPGLTGWAQVCYPYGASTEDSLRKLQFDLYYIKNHSLLLDLNILMRTVLITLRRGGR
jgi:exopolysaccharide biosynthesis polyprenyl glycosylphosphotransferase